MTGPVTRALRPGCFARETFKRPDRCFACETFALPPACFARETYPLPVLAVPEIPHGKT
jgi:hypothetical protein